MQPGSQTIDFAYKVEEFCRINKLAVPNLVNLVLSEAPKAANTMLNAKMEAVLDNSVFSEERLAKVFSAYNKRAAHLETQFGFLSNWSGLSHKNWQMRIYGSQMLMERLLGQDLDEYVSKQQEFESKAEAAIPGLDQEMKETAMNMIGKTSRDISIFKIKEESGAKNDPNPCQAKD